LHTKSKDVLGDDVVIRNPVGKSLTLNGSYPSDPSAQMQTFSYFILAVLGFSFWFFMVVPFASHRESYGWIAALHTESLGRQFAFGLSSTYRPLAQIVTRLGFVILDPRTFPTSVLRQALLQGFIYGMFILAWWLIYSVAPQKRLFALIAFLSGGVFFSGYVHLFHIYGMFYVPVILTLGTLLHLYASDRFDQREIWFAIIAISLAFWHPFATALFLGFDFGFYVDTSRQRNIAQHVQTLVILLVGMMAIGMLVVLFPRTHLPLGTRLFGFLVSYQTNELNKLASFTAFVLTGLVVFSMGLSRRLKLAAFLFVSALSVMFLFKSLPLLLLWLFAVLVKLSRLRCWSLFFLMLTAALLPFGGGIGTPIYALFAIIMAIYVTPLGWSQAEKELSFIRPGYVTGTIVACAIVLLMVRAGIDVPIVTSAATPLLAERERTYQLEKVLAWLHTSDYCGYEVDFVENAGSPVDSVESAITRRNRPPAAIQDVRLFWDTVLRCPNDGLRDKKEGTAIVTFGGPALADSQPVFEVAGKYGGDATVWIRDSQK
jgi:hypothetical protein